MTSDQLQRFADSLHEEAERLWTKMENLCRQPTIHPKDVIELAARTSGVMEGMANAMEWHVKHEEK